MSRASLNITLTAPLIRANLRQRLDKLAARTDLPPTAIAGRALLFGLTHLESDLTLLFAGVAAQTETQHTATAPTAAPPTIAEHNNVQPCAAQPALPTTTASTTEDAASSIEQPTATAADEKPASAPPPAVKTPTAPRADEPERVTTKVAAAALRRSKSAFAMHLQRHPELRRCSRKAGGIVLWDLPRLRAEWSKK